MLGDSHFAFLPQVTASLLVQNYKVHRALAQMKTSVASWVRRYPPCLLAIDVNILGKQGTEVPSVCAPCWEHPKPCNNFSNWLRNVPSLNHEFRFLRIGERCSRIRRFAVREEVL